MIKLFCVSTVPNLIEKIENKNEAMKEDNIGYEETLKKPFKFKTELENLIRRQTELNLELNIK